MKVFATRSPRIGGEEASVRIVVPAVSAMATQSV